MIASSIALVSAKVASRGRICRHIRLPPRTDECGTNGLNTFGQVRGEGFLSEKLPSTWGILACEKRMFSNVAIHAAA